MNFRPSSSSPGPKLDAAGRSIQRQAAEWFARRQGRGFGPVEQAEFANWLARDPRHAAIFAEVEASWTALDRLTNYPRSIGSAPDPDLLVPAWTWRSYAAWSRPFSVAAGIAIAIGTLWWVRPPAAPVARPTPVAMDPATSSILSLPDGSVAELKAESQVFERFTAVERRVRLVRGEAHFSVTKDPGRQFVVEVNGVVVRAVGTAFNVRLGVTGVEVLVTEGTVQIEPPVAPSSVASTTVSFPAEVAAVLTVGQRAVVPTVPSADIAPPVIETLTAADIDRALSWQSSRFTFESAPLADVVARFNRHAGGEKGAPRLSVGDARLTDLRISGRIRSDNVESFVEVLESSFGIVAERRSDGEIVLRRSSRP